MAIPSALKGKVFLYLLGSTVGEGPLGPHPNCTAGLEHSYFLGYFQKLQPTKYDFCLYQ